MANLNDRIEVMQQPVEETGCVARAPPRLAIVIPCFNYEQYVGRAIASVLEQGCEDCEVIVVDDGSTDGSWNIISRSGVNAIRIANGGQRAACLAGLERTRAPFVLFLDADDELKPGALQVILSLLDERVAKVQFALTRVDAHGRVLAERHAPISRYRARERLVREVLRNGVYSTPPTSGNVFRRDLCELLREADYDRAVDGVILFAAPFFGDVVSVDRALALYRVHGGNDSGAGRTPEAGVFARDMERFLARMQHLRAVIRRRGEVRPLATPEQTLYFRRLTFYHAVASGRRPPLRHLFGLLLALAAEPLRPLRKAGLAGFYVVAALLPNRQARSLMALRFGPDRRLGRASARLKRA